MNWLIWKEYRQNRVILLVAAALLILPHAVALWAAWYDAGPPPGAAHGMPRLPYNVMFAALYSLAICQLVMALLGGNAIAGERIDRSAEFLFYLPLSRARILAAKIAVAVATTAVIWIPNLVVLLAFSRAIPEPERPQIYRQFWGFLGNVATTGLVFFTVAWLLSSLLESPTFSICGGLTTPCLIILALQLVNWLLVSNDDWMIWMRWLGLLYSPICLILAAGSFTAGTWYYLRRVEP